MLATPEIKALYEERKNKFMGLEVTEVEKVVLTEKQAEALKKVLQNNGESKDSLLSWHADFLNRKEHAWTNFGESLNKLSIVDLAKALYVGYEVEKPEFKTGDKVILWGKVVTLKENRELMGVETWGVEENNGVRLHTSDLIRATPEEIYWLETLGRKEVGLFKYTDVFVDGDGDAHLLRGVHPSDGHRSLEDAEYWYGTGFFKGIFPAESFKPFPKEAVKCQK